MALALHRRLASPYVVGSDVVAQTVLDLTVYVPALSFDQLVALIEIYEALCPKGRRGYYTIPELIDWDPVGDPDLTKHGREAARKGAPRPYLAPVRRRIEQGREFSFRLWDGREADSFSFSTQSADLWSEDSEWTRATYVRMLFPLDTDVEVVHGAAVKVCDEVDVLSGHGGLCCSYHPDYKHDAFTENYARARRWWGLDLEDLELTLQHVHQGIKGAQWLTILGHQLAGDAAVEAGVGGLGGAVTVERRQHALVIRAGDQPVAGDQHRTSPGLDAYEQVAKAVEPIVLQAHPEFIGDGFLSNGNTMGWLNRFTDQDGWR